MHTSTVTPGDNDRYAQPYYPYKFILKWPRSSSTLVSTNDVRKKEINTFNFN